MRERNRLEGFLIGSFLVVVALTCILPLVHELALSLSSNEAVLSRKVALVPVEPTLNSYRQILKDGSVMRALGFSATLTAAFTAIAMALTTALAYPLTRPEFRHRKAVMTFVVITMYFSGGILPLYILIKSLGMMNTIWALILPLAVSPFNTIIMRTALSSIPESLTESALLDGASYFQILRRIVLPLSLPIIATLSLFYAVGRWNTFQDALFYITKTGMYTLQLKLTYIVLANSSPEVFMAEGAESRLSVANAALTAATAMVATLPILAVYPWLQRYFIKGTMIGSIKE
ncbi:MAG: carbohydrate ABC transporter permease [Spirochaetaceae bacterium]|nr:carbohydrate ABC transporter permease [Spirochaetaceae bacterium]